MLSPEEEYAEYYKKQDHLRNKVIKENQLPDKIVRVAGVDVAYNEESQRMIGSIVVLDAKTLAVVEQCWHEMEITFPYVPGLFSFREIPPLLEAYKKLETKPDIIVCDGQGIAHPKGVGMASHLGVELNVPTIGCAKKRLIGKWDKKQLASKRGSMQSLLLDNQEIGMVLRTQDDIKPVFVSIGHKVDLTTATNWVLQLAPKYRLPETTRQADQLVNRLL